MRTSKGSRKLKKIIGWMAAAFLLYIIGSIGLSPAEFSTPSLPKHFPASHKVAGDEDEWNLILVTSEYYVPADYAVDLTRLSNGQCIDTRIYPDLQEMFDAARADGIYMVVASGYRSEEKQASLYEEKIQAYLDEGYSRLAATELAEQWVAIPGTSEHQLGIAVDINQDASKSTADDVYNWLSKNAYKYGFIQRYSSDKTEITGVIYEPWHYRYVGPEAAAEIYSQDICLEEYIETLK